MIKILLQISTLVLAFTLLTNCTKKDDEFAGFVNFPLVSNIKGMDPVNSSDLYSGWVMGEIYDQLLQYSYLERPTKVEPMLADGMPEVSKDGLTYTFKIKKGVLFHDDPSFKATGGKGREIVAEDFIYAWKRVADPVNKSDGFWIFEGKIKGMAEWRDEMSKAGKTDYTKPISGVTAVDDHTLRIQLVKAYPQLLYVLTMIPASVVPHEAVEFYGPEFQNHPVGSGPYKFKSWVRNSKVILVKNPTYRVETYPTKGEAGDQEKGFLADAGKQLPLNDGVTFTEIIEDQPRWLNFRKGELDLSEIPKDNFDSAVKNDSLIPEMSAQGVVLTKWIDPDTTFNAINMEDPVLGGVKGKLIRQAMALAVDTPELIKKFYNNRAIPAEGPVPPTLTGYDPKLKNPYKGPNIEKAKALLKKAGYPNGEGLPEIVYETYSGSTSRQIVEFFQQCMARIGIKIKINQNTWPEFLSKQKARKAQMFGMAWSADYPDAENYLQLFYGPNASPGPNSSNYNNPAFNKLYEQAAVMPDSSARNKLYAKMVDIVVEDEPFIFDVHRKAYVLTQGWLKNYKRNMITLNFMKYLRVDTQAKKELKPKL